MKVWVLEGSETSYGFGEDAFEVLGVYANHDLAERASIQHMREHPKGEVFIGEHELQQETDQ